MVAAPLFGGADDRLLSSAIFRLESRDPRAARGAGFQPAMPPFLAAFFLCWRLAAMRGRRFRLPSVRAPADASSLAWDHGDPHASWFPKLFFDIAQPTVPARVRTFTHHVVFGNGPSSEQLSGWITWPLNQADHTHSPS